MESSSCTVMRTEKKYQIPLTTRAMLVKRLSKIMDTDRHGGICGYMVRSLYFDSIDDSDLFDKINGLEFRKKIRLRIYSPGQKWVKLELKQKQGSAQVKKTLEISREDALALMGGNLGPIFILDGGFPRELYQMMSCGLYRPKCIVEYRRTAFTSRTNDIRITIDQDIQVSRDCSRFFEPAPALTPLLQWPVLEVKYNHFLLDPYREAVNLADIPEMAFSKYEIAGHLVN